MKRQRIAGIYASPEAFGGQTLTVCGWARTIRDMKNFGFIELNDGSCFKSLQVVLERGKLENYDDIARQNVGAAFIVHGELVLTPDAKQPFELKADSITLEGASAPDYPLPYSALKALHAVASMAGETGYGPFWAGTGCAAARPGTAAEILGRLAP